MKANLIDRDIEIECKINHYIVEKILGMSANEAVVKFLKNMEGLKEEISGIFNFMRAVFKIKVRKSENSLYFNICEYFINGEDVEIKWALEDMEAMINFR